MGEYNLQNLFPFPMFLMYSALLFLIFSFENVNNTFRDDFFTIKKKVLKKNLNWKHVFDNISKNFVKIMY